MGATTQRLLDEEHGAAQPQLAVGQLVVLRKGDGYIVSLAWEDPVEGERHVPLMVLQRGRDSLWYAAGRPDQLCSSRGHLTLHDALSSYLMCSGLYTAFAAAVAGLVAQVRPQPMPKLPPMGGY